MVTSDLLALSFLRILRIVACNKLSVEHYNFTRYYLVNVLGIFVQVIEVEDVVAPSKEEYTDGVGAITPVAMEEALLRVQQQVGRRLVGMNVSAIQFRMAGSKGVLARWNACDVKCAFLDASLS